MGIFNNYSTSACWIWVGYNHLISKKRQWNNCFIKNAHKISKILPDFICKNSRFSAGFKFRADAYSYHIWRVWYNGSYTMVTKPIRALELHCPMIQFFIKVIIMHQVSKPAKLLTKRSWKRREKQIPFFVLNSSFYVYY